MKLLCVRCDEPMQFGEAMGPEQGSMSITFVCPRCGNGVTLLTNAGETQLVRSLYVHIGGPRVTVEPMELVRHALARQREQAFAPQQDVSQLEKMPVWTEDAEKRLENVPAFARGMARKAIERYAMEEACDKITPEVLDRAREQRGG